MVISLSPFIFIFCLFPSFLYGIKKYSSYLLFIFSYFCINLLSKISLWKFVKLHNVISTERKKWEVSEQTYPNDYLPRFSQKKKSQLKWQSSRSLFSTCWNGWISYTEPKWLFCLQFTESQDSSSHLGATELWQSVIFVSYFLYAPRRRAVMLPSVYDRNCLNYLQWTEGQLGGEDGEAGAIL